jgi:hypothetical protein
MTNPVASQQPAPIPEHIDEMPPKDLAEYCARLEAALREFLEHVGTVEQPNACCRVTKFRKDKLRAALATPLGTPGREKP